MPTVNKINCPLSNQKIAYSYISANQKIAMLYPGKIWFTWLQQHYQEENIHSTHTMGVPYSGADIISKLGWGALPQLQLLKVGH